ncbi:FAD/FMN-containing dehydrogenase [Phyllobacterium sp. CL33Tsu]|nr:FAD/FMN-containing dehydrogenase [Phyllobacterium sp. CL33Tsu]
MTSYMVADDIRSWGGTVKAQHFVSRPSWREQLPELLARKEGRSVLGIGLRRSYGDSGLNPDGSLIDMTALDRVISFDPVTRLLRAEAGIAFDSILELFVQRGYFLPVTPGTRFVTLGGAVANDVHGKNHHSAGTIGRWVRRIGLIRSDGTEIELTPDDQTGLFAATIGGLGLTGLISWAEIELLPIDSAMMEAETIPFANLDAFFAVAAESDDAADYTVAWVDCLARGDRLGRGLFSRARHAPLGARLTKRAKPKLSMPFAMPGFMLNATSIGLFNGLYFYRGRRAAGPAITPYQPYFYPLDAIGHWNRMYGSRGMYQYQSVVPPATARDATREMLETISKAGEGSFLAVLKTFGGVPSPGLLSFPQAGTTLALDFPNKGQLTLDLLNRLDDIVREAGGRLYPAKDGRISASMFRAGYPAWETFANHVDPAFSSAFWRRVSQ